MRGRWGPRMAIGFGGAQGAKETCHLHHGLSELGSAPLPPQNKKAHTHTHTLGAKLGVAEARPAGLVIFLRAFPGRIGILPSEGLAADPVGRLCGFFAWDGDGPYAVVLVGELEGPGLGTAVAVFASDVG